MMQNLEIGDRVECHKNMMMSMRKYRPSTHHCMIAFDDDDNCESWYSGVIPDSVTYQDTSFPQYFTAIHRLIGLLIDEADVGIGVLDCHSALNILKRRTEIGSMLKFDCCRKPSFKYNPKVCSQYFETIRYVLERTQDIDGHVW